MESMDPAELQEMMAEVEVFNTALQHTGAFLFAGALHPPSSATTVDATGDGAEFTPGPFAEATEHLGGRRSAGRPADRGALPAAIRRCATDPGLPFGGRGRQGRPTSGTRPGRAR